MLHLVFTAVLFACEVGGTDCPKGSFCSHLSAILVDAGKRVKRGDPIGIEGNSGLAGAKHIHWSVHRGAANGGGSSIPFRVATSVALASASKKLGARLSPPFFMGFSNGGFFVALLAAETQVQSSGFAVLHGGLPTGVSALERARARPTLLIAAAEASGNCPRCRNCRS